MLHFTTRTFSEKGTGNICEDALVVSGNLAAVFDGATSLSGATYDGKTGGYLAAQIAKSVFSQHRRPLPALAELANRQILLEMEARGVDTSRPEEVWSASAAAVRIHDSHIEWVQCGDSLVLVVFEDGSHRLMVTDYDHDLETLLMWQEVSLSTDQPIAVAMADQIRKVRGGMNKTYGVLNGDPEMKRFLRHGIHPLSGVKQVLLFTDGFLIPKADPEAPDDMDTLARLCMETGLSGAAGHIRSLQKTDPLCRKFPRFKLHDDIAAVSITFLDITDASASAVFSLTA